MYQYYRFFIGTVFKKETLKGIALFVAAIGTIPHLTSLIIRIIHTGQGPFSTRYEIFSSNALVLMLFYLISSYFFKPLRAIGLVVIPVVFLMMGLSVDTFELKKDVPIIFRSYWLYLHVLFAKAFGASVIISAGTAIFYLIKAKTDPEGALRYDLLVYRFLVSSFLFLSVMIIAGSIWAHQSWGRYWGWDPIEVSSLATWMVIGLILHLRSIHGWRGKRMAALSFVALAFTAFTLYIVTLVVPTIHDAYLVGK